MADFSTAAKPAVRPQNPNFSSGPCAKRPGFTLAALEGALLGRSHRAKGPKARLAEVIERSRAMLGMPADWRLGIVPASDTGAIEAICDQVLAANPKAVAEYKGGKLASINFLKGQVMKLSQGKANPNVVAEVLTRKLSE